MRIEKRRRDFVQICRGGKLWAEVMRVNPDGSMRLRCDSAGRRSAPLINDEFDVPADEVILDRASV